MRKVLASVLAFVLAAGLLPANAFAAAGEGLSATAAQLVPQSPLDNPNYDWYKGNEGASQFNITTPHQLAGFANLVNGTADFDGDGVVDSPAVDFSGKTVSLVRRSGGYGFEAGEWVPIGDEQHPFAGTFDGGSFELHTFSISGVGRSSYIGFFGYVSSQGSLNNVAVKANTSVEVAGITSGAVHHVGGVAGYCAGTMSFCESYAQVSVSTSAGQTAEDPQVAYAIGGVAGECSGKMVGCSNEGAVTVSASAAADAGVGGSLVSYVGGVAGVHGDMASIGTLAAPVAASGSLLMDACDNTAQVTVEAPSARCSCIGGLVGYSQASFDGCTNGVYYAALASSAGYVRAGRGSAIGGIVGAWRASAVSPEDSLSADDGSSGDNPDATALEMFDCVNYGDVYGGAAVGGLVGAAGSYTTVRACKSSMRENSVSTYVVATGTGEAAPGGIAGMTFGDVVFCSNSASVYTGSWSDESSRSLTRGSGTCAAGIVGRLAVFSGALEGAPVPEVYGCYNVAAVSAPAGMMQRAIVADNEGFVHGNVSRAGMVENDALVGSGGTVKGNVALGAADMRGKAAPAALNVAYDPAQPNVYWSLMSSPDTTDPEDNFGYPVLVALAGSSASDYPIAASKRTSIASFTWGCSDAPYTGATGRNAAKPDVELFDGAGNKLVPWADFLVVPDTSATEIGSQCTATIAGIGFYSGSLKASYVIGEPEAEPVVVIDLSTAKVTGLSTLTYTGKPLTPSPKVAVAGRTLVAGADYTLGYVNNMGPGTATVVVTGKGSYTGTARATFSIKRANTIAAKAKSKVIAVSRKKVKKKAQPIAAKKAFSVTKAKGKVTFKKVKGSAKITVTSAGKVTVKKGCKKGIYSVKVNVTAAGNATYFAKTKQVILKVRVK